MTKRDQLDVPDSSAAKCLGLACRGETLCIRPRSSSLRWLAAGRTWSRLGFCIAAVALQQGGFIALLHAQGAGRASLAGEQAATYARIARPENYNFRLGEASFQTEASLGLEYNDNVFLSHNSRQADIILRPEVALRGYWPVTELNALTFSVGIAYNYYFQTAELNAGRPEINPGTELAFTVFTGDVRLTFFDRFYYQDTVQTWTTTLGSGQDFISFSNVQLFSRLDNRVGMSVAWDLNDLIVSGTFTHENFVSFTEAYSYLTRASEQLLLSTSFLPGEKVRPGFEIPIEYSDYKAPEVADQWRIAVGPVVEVTMTPHFNLRAGASFQEIQYLGGTPETPDLLAYNVYVRLNQRVNEWMHHSLEVSHLNLPGWNAGNTATTSIGYRADFSFLRHTTLTANVSWNRADQTGGIYQENFDYVIAGLRLNYQFSEHANLECYYGFVQKTSDQVVNDYLQNQVGAQLTYRF